MLPGWTQALGHCPRALLRSTRADELLVLSVAPCRCQAMPRDAVACSTLAHAMHGLPLSSVERLYSVHFPHFRSIIVFGLVGERNARPPKTAKASTALSMARVGRRTTG